MGVLGLNPFLQRVCPDVFTSLPNRFGGLSGKRVIFDGTLITQRLHFAPMPHPHRHVLGWYRIIQELKESSVTAVCVFDGKSRNAAKQREVERRRETRKTAASRGYLEKHRLIRLQKLLAVVKALNSLDLEARSAVLDGLRHTSQDHQLNMIPSPSNHATDVLIPPDEFFPTSTFNRHETMHADAKVASIAPQSRHALPNPNCAGSSHVDSVTDPVAPSQSDDMYGRDDSTAEEVSSLVEDSDERVPQSSVIQSSPDSTTMTEGMMTTITGLYAWYRKSVQSLQAFVQPASSPSLPILDESTDNHTELMVSKAQQELTAAEGDFWQLFFDPTFSSPDVLETTAVALTEKSSILSESYDRRTQVPTLATYEQSKEILRALGIPCIETDGPYEAEAVAAAMVLRGHADYVASEDTDVLVYGAPLVRNISTRMDPLIVVSGTDVRERLKLDQSQFIDFALLLGTDFSQRIKNVGPARALKFIRKYSSIERIVEHEKQYTPREPIVAYLQQVALARMIFRTLPPTPKGGLTQVDADPDAVQEIMHRYDLERGLSNEHLWPDNTLPGENYFKDNPFGP